ncbi:MAG: hypothetical protein GXP19_04650 [Gammaproteobacteria bacterium]|nr:hypothetical protein [Gammaproteobacteria bacterium]
MNRTNKKIVWILLSVLISMMLYACASVSTLPRRASDVNFVDHVSGVPSVRNYDYCANYIDADKETLFEAAKYSLVTNKFDIKETNAVDDVIRGEHGVSARDWNIVAGIYFKEVSNGVAVKIIVRTAVSTSLYRNENGTAKDWSHKIISGIETYLHRNLDKSVTTMQCG